MPTLACTTNDNVKKLYVRSVGHKIYNCFTVYQKIKVEDNPTKIRATCSHHDNPQLSLTFLTEIDEIFTTYLKSVWITKIFKINYRTHPRKPFTNIYGPKEASQQPTTN